MILTVIVALTLLPDGMAYWEHDTEITGKIHTGSWNKEQHSAAEITSGNYPAAIGDIRPDYQTE
ncbi:hypothetical protein [Pelotomaculum sp. PtaB.Bin117]|uniref:hypothetical protein n=1 Tax=Pelotomaculum sp. PtaB.Bin117 TaxID=1811694 RepID=UPI0009D06857|nr:hypothetical protein [Pelotomaculum sp. PtaB.Bin117]OPX89159.1 MAG: hypothetical protein A4E54_01075 [Pelotomaculum sp. PtaB.Bin117]